MIVPHTTALKVDEALKRLLDGAKAVATETIPLDKCQGRVLAHDIYAKRTQPPFSASAMDGYAVRAVDVSEQGAVLTIIDEVAAGYVSQKKINAGEAIRIFTGAPLPDGADAILIQEDAHLLPDNQIRAESIVKLGSYVRPAGLDFKDGDLLLQKGTVLDAGALCLAAAGNYAALPIISRPRIGILATGDELREPGSELQLGQIIASNSYGVAAIVREYGGEPIDLGIARDTKSSLSDALQSAIEQKCDCLITLGGASVGEHDLVRSAFIEAGMNLDFWKILMRPGKPLMYGVLNNMHIIGLPGNPVSSLVCAHLFVAPLIAKLGFRQHKTQRYNATLTHDLGPNGQREHYARAKITRHGNTFHANVFENQDSSIISLYSAANALIVRPINAPALSVGEEVEFIKIGQIT